jgi:apolipoprotein N-acyltransferase
LTAGLAPAFAPLICYEAIFPGEVLAGDPPRPGWLLNVTNDAWFGDTQGPRQHFRQARLRAVEEGLPLVRAANTGISAIVDAYGRANTLLDVGEEGVIDGGLPQSLPPTSYALYRDMVPGSLVLLSLFTAFIGSVARRRRGN